MLDWLMHYRRDALRFDVLAGLTAAAVVLPKSMAYAAIAGLPVQVGLYTAMVPLVVYALLGTSPVLSVSTVRSPTNLWITSDQCGRLRVGRLDP